MGIKILALMIGALLIALVALLEQFFMYRQHQFTADLVKWVVFEDEGGYRHHFPCGHRWMFKRLQSAANYPAHCKLLESEMPFAHEMVEKFQSQFAFSYLLGRFHPPTKICKKRLLLENKYRYFYNILYHYLNENRVYSIIDRRLSEKEEIQYDIVRLKTMHMIAFTFSDPSQAWDDPYSFNWKASEEMDRDRLSEIQAEGCSS